MTLDSKIEAILFWKSEPVNADVLAKMVGCSHEELEQALLVLEEKLSERGITLVKAGSETALGTDPELSELIEKLSKDEMGKEISKASLDTLSVILYKNGISRAEIDYIRGVNSSFILRNLSIRGLIDRSVDPRDTRRNIYKPSIDLLSHLGVSKVEDLPGWEEISKSLNQNGLLENENME